MNSIIIKKFNLIQGLEIEFLPNRSVLCLKGRYGQTIVQMPSFYFFNLDFNKLQQFSFMFLNKFFFVSFLKHVAYLMNRLHVLYFLRLKIKGLGYRIKKMSKMLYRFYFTTTNYIYFHLPRHLFVRARKRRLLLISNNYDLLRVIYVNILLLKRLSPYNRRGIFFPRQIMLLKPGKKII